jgi:signal peptidase II
MHFSVRTRWLCFVYFVVLIVLDACVKSLTLKYVDLLTWFMPNYPYGGIGVFENFLGINFSINYVENRGSAFGLFASYSEWLLAIRVAIVAGLLGYLFFYLKQERHAFPLSMILAGAIGNIIDCFRYGFVVDMFHFVFFGYDFAVFNVADSSICIGVILFFIFSIKDHYQQRKAWHF